MKIPNINCKHYTKYGLCGIQKGWFFLKNCPLSQDFSLTCDMKEIKVHCRPLTGPGSFKK